jgi:TolB protein
MDDPVEFDDPGMDPPVPPGRGRRILQAAIIVGLVVSMVFLALISGRGVVIVQPEPVPSATASPTPPPARLAVVDAGGRLTVMDENGGSVIALGRAAMTYSFPAWSPDGTHLAVTGLGGDAGEVEVFAGLPDGSMAPDALTVYRSPDRPPFYLYWSPDSRRLAFLTTEPDGLALRIAPADGSTAAAAVRTGAPLYWDWVAADRLLVHAGAGLAGAVSELEIDGTVVATDKILPGTFRVPSTTSDGAFRAFVVPGARAPDEVVVEARDGSNRHGVEVYGGAAIDFGPSTDTLAFIAPDRAGAEVALPVGPLRLVDARSGVARTVLRGSIVAFFWSSDGRTIAALEIGGPGGDNVAAGDAILAVAKGAEPRPNHAPVAAPGVGLRLIFVEVSSGTIRSQRAVRVGDVFIGQVLPYFDQYALSHRFWSADDRSIALPLVDAAGTTHVVVIDADGSAPNPIADGVAAAWSP